MKTVFGKYRQRTTVLERGYTHGKPKKKKRKGERKGVASKRKMKLRIKYLYKN